MIKKMLSFIFCLYIFKSHADAPGKQAMSSSKIIVQNINRFSDYDFYWQLEYDSAKLINRDTTLIIPSSNGAPYNAGFWAVNRKTKTSTDTLTLENYYAPDYLITIDSIENDKFRYTKKEVSNSNLGGVSGDKNDVDYVKTNSTKIILFSAVSLTALILLVWFFIRRKNAAREV